MPRFRTIGCWIIAIALAGCAANRQSMFEAGADEALDMVTYELLEVQAQEALRQGLPVPPKQAAVQMRRTESPEPKPPAPKRQTPVASPCTHLAYRNPVIDRILIPGGVYGGVYIPTHYEYVVYQTGRWEIVSSHGNPQTTVPSFPFGCQTPPRENQP